MPPIIGITPGPSDDTLPHGTFRRYVLSSRYVAAISAAGGTPVILPPVLSAIDDYLATVDGLLLSGGGDIEPWRFGDHDLHPTTYGLSPERDEFELALLDRAIATDRPLLAICRGIQVLNVALGGTLHQDVSLNVDSRLSEPILHRQHDAAKAADEIGHLVTLADTWPLPRPATGPPPTLGVNSFHHQAIARLGAGLVPLATAADGLVEAAHLPDRRFVLGLQWHPELMFERHPEHLEPFRALVEAAVASRLLAPR